jgi:hypothetical protein
VAAQVDPRVPPLEQARKLDEPDALDLVQLQTELGEACIENGSGIAQRRPQRRWRVGECST